LLLALASQAKDNSFADALKLTDSPDEVIKFIFDFHASVRKLIPAATHSGMPFCAAHRPRSLGDAKP